VTLPGPLTTDQSPVPEVGAVAPNTADAGCGTPPDVVAQMVSGVPATAVLGVALYVYVAASVVLVQALLVIVHANVYRAAVMPVNAVVAECRYDHNSSRPGSLRPGTCFVGCNSIGH